MVNVYLKDGQRIQLPTAVRVKHENFEISTNGITCFDEDDQIVGRFLNREIAGYDLESRTPQNWLDPRD